MTWKGRYSPEPLNSPSDEMDGQIDERLREALNSSAVFGSYANGSIPQSAVRTPVVEQIPVAGVDGDEVYYVADSDNGVVWHFRYRAAGSPSYPWECVGGPSLRSEIATSQTTASTSYVDLTTAGPSVTTPLSGDYILHFGLDLNNSGANYSIAAVKIGAAATVDADAVFAFSGSASGVEVSVSRTMVKTALAASTELKVQYKASAGTLAAAKRFLYVTPVRVGA